MKTHLTFDEAVEVLNQASFNICLNPHTGEALVVSFIGWDEDGDYIVEPEGCDRIYMDPKLLFKITDDGRGFCVPDHVLQVFPNKPFNLRECQNERPGRDRKACGRG